MPSNRIGKSPWLKAVLIPFWILQILFMAILLGAIGWLLQYDLLGCTLRSSPSRKSAKLILNCREELLIIIICAVCLILDITEIILFAKHILQPLIYLVLSVVKTTVWFIIFMITVVGTVKEGGGTSGTQVLLGGFVESVILLYEQKTKLALPNMPWNRRARISPTNTLTPSQHILSRDPHLRQRNLPSPPPRQSPRQRTPRLIHRPLLQRPFQR